MSPHLGLCESRFTFFDFYHFAPRDGRLEELEEELADQRDRAEGAEKQRDAALAQLASRDAAHEQELAREQAAAEERRATRAAAERMEEQLAALRSRGTAPRMNWFLSGSAQVNKRQSEALTGLPRVGLVALISLCLHCRCDLLFRTTQDCRDWRDNLLLFLIHMKTGAL